MVALRLRSPLALPQASMAEGQTAEGIAYGKLNGAGSLLENPSN
jgi:hypothetical protein